MADLASSRLWLHLLLMVGVVVVYDLWRGQPSDPSPVAPTGATDERDVPRPAVPMPREEFAELLRRVERLEASRRSAASEPPVHAPAPADAPRMRPVPYEVPTLDRTFTPEEVARFRALMSAAQQQQRAEAVARGLSRALDALQEPLERDTRRAVLDVSLRVWNDVDRVRLHDVAMPASDRRAALEDAARALASALAGVLPEGREADVTRLVQRHLRLAPDGASPADPDDARARARHDADNPPR